MIIQNGYISFHCRCEEPVLDKGAIVETQEGCWSDPIPCQWRVMKRDYQASSNAGEARVSASYEILINDEEIWGEKIRLYDMVHREIIETAVISQEHLHLLSIRRLIV